MVKKYTRPIKSRPVASTARTTSTNSLPSATLHDLPDDLLEKVALQMKLDGKFGSLAALDQASKRLSAVCKPILWKDVTLRNASHPTILFEKSGAHLRSLVQYLYIDTHDSTWFWKAIRAMTSAQDDREIFVHAALPNIKMILEYCAITPECRVERSVQDASARDFHIWLSARNHTRISDTMKRAIQAVVLLSDLQYDCLDDFIDDITSMPTFTFEYDPDGFSIDKDLYLRYSQCCLRGSFLHSFMSPDLIKETSIKTFDAYKAGMMHIFPPIATPSFQLVMNGLVKRTAGEGVMLQLEGIGYIPIHLMLQQSLPNVPERSARVTYELFLQSARIFSTTSNLECYGPMLATVACWNIRRAEELIRMMLLRHNKDQLRQDDNPPTGLAINLKEEWSVTALFSTVWERIQKPFIAHLERLPVKITTELPQKLIIRAKYDERVQGIPVVEMDLASASTRHVTMAGLCDDEEGVIRQQVYRDGKLMSTRKQRSA